MIAVCNAGLPYQEAGGSVILIAVYNAGLPYQEAGGSVILIAVYNAGLPYQEAGGSAGRVEAAGGQDHHSTEGSYTRLVILDTGQ